MSKLILVTGANGFIGKHLLSALHQDGWQIRVALRRDFSEPPSVPIQAHTITDIDGQTDWQEALQGVNVVIHLAARAHILQDHSSDPEADFLRVNTDGTANLVKQAIRCGVQHFIFLSSVGAMATVSDQTLTEESFCQPDTSYGRSKLKAEEALVALASNSAMTWTILRPTLVYGFGNPGNMERLIKLINLGLPLPFGSIHNQRSFTYVGNLVDAILRILTHPNAINQIFLVSDGEDISTPELMRLIARSTQQSSTLFPCPPQLLKLIGVLGDAMQAVRGKAGGINSTTIDRLLGSLVVDSSKIRSMLDWNPPYNVLQGLKKTF
jgi:nucleoside-diphosphate-sugar epimerase